MIKIRIDIDREKLGKLRAAILKPLIIHRAYKGYCQYLKLEGNGSTPKTIYEFNDFELWKIEICFRLYLSYFRNEKRGFVYDYDLKAVIFDKL